MKQIIKKQFDYDIYITNVTKGTKDVLYLCLCLKNIYLGIIKKIINRSKCKPYSLNLNIFLDEGNWWGKDLIILNLPFPIEHLILGKAKWK